jgi:small-conductance mechanosensitive channel
MRMSLTDLKKNKDRSNSKGKVKGDFTIDEFIADADNYAKGNPQIVSNENHGKMNLKQAIRDAKRLIQQKKQEDLQSKPFRRATFTLSENTIEQLKVLSEESDLAKSHILRILIDELSNKEQEDQIKKLFESDVD